MAWRLLSTQMQPLAAVFTAMCILYTNIISRLSLSSIEKHEEIVLTTSFQIWCSTKIDFLSCIAYCTSFRNRSISSCYECVHEQCVWHLSYFVRSNRFNSFVCVSVFSNNFWTNFVALVMPAWQLWRLLRRERLSCHQLYHPEVAVVSLLQKL
jgi:hypothetical protein